MRRKCVELTESRSNTQNGIQQKFWSDIDCARHALQRLAEEGIDVDSVIVTSTRGRDSYNPSLAAWSYNFFRGERNVATYIVGTRDLMTQPGPDGFGRKWGIGDQGESRDHHVVWKRLPVTQWLPADSHVSDS